MNGLKFMIVYRMFGCSSCVVSRSIEKLKTPLTEVPVLTSSLLLTEKNGVSSKYCLSSVFFAFALCYRYIVSPFMTVLVPFITVSRL